MPLTSLMGSVGGITEIISATPAVEATPDYSPGDVMGGKISLLKATRLEGHSGYITSACIKSKADITVPIDVIFFSSDPSGTTFTENSAISLDAADVAKIIGAVQVFQWFDLGTPVVGFAECRIPFRLTLSTGTTLYAVMVPRGTINLASTSDLVLEVAVEQN